MQGEVDGGEGGLQGGELGAGEGAVGDYAVDEGLVDGAAEEGAVTGGVVESVADMARRCGGEAGGGRGERGGRADLMMW